MVPMLFTPQKSWRPDRPVSKGANAYHEAIINSSWHIDNVDELIKIVVKKIKENDVVVDFGAGTGGSALYLLKKSRVPFKLWLVDNSPAWLGKAYEVLNSGNKIEFFLLDKIGERYATLAETVGKNTADHVISANTVHLIPDIVETFKGINGALKPNGTFTFESGNIKRSGRQKGVLMIDDTVKRVHEIALEIVKMNDKFTKYRKDLDERIDAEKSQRKFVFPDPRPVDFYLDALKSAGFEYEEPVCKLIKVKYDEWLDFLRVKRLQAGILPEVGGKEPSVEEEHDRDALITMSATQLFRELEAKNPMAGKKSFTAEWAYVSSIKAG